MKNRKLIYFVITIVILGLIGGGILFFKKGGTDNKNNEESVDNSVWSPNYNQTTGQVNLEGNTGSKVSAMTLTPENSNQYKSDKYSFSFLYPKDFSVSNFPDEGTGSEIILVQNPKIGQGFQIMITPFDEDISVLTAERVKSDIPDLKMDETLTLDLGSYGKGIAFMSDNENFGGNSREVWFVWKKNLYQISTYAHLDPILQSVMNNWQFY